MDSEVLALLVEEASDLRPEEIVRNAFDGSLVRIQAQRDQAWVNQLPRLETAFVEVANEVSEWVPSPERRALYSPTGLSTSSCRLIHDHIEANKSYVQELLLDAGPGQIDDLADLLLPVCLRLSEMAPEIQFGGSFEDLLSYWISGRSLRSLMANFKDDANSPESLGRFIDDLFRYKLPWGIPGYLRIAAESLGLDRSQLSQYARFLPSMIKYGVPDPTACWALSIGVPSRLIAMKVAVAYEAEALETTSYEAFLDWLGGLSREQLRREFELPSPLLEETTRAIFLSSLNPMLQDESPLRGFLPREERVHDIDPDDPALQLRVRAGQSVELKRDYDDLVDKNAISVNSIQQRIGNLPRRVAQVLAPEMDTGLQLAAVPLNFCKLVSR